MRKHFLHLDSCPDDLSPAGAYKELCRSATPYTNDSRPDLAIYQEEALSWPPEGTHQIDPISAMPFPHFDSLMHWREKMLKPNFDALTENSSNSNSITPYSDPILMRSNRKYGRFLKGLHSRSMIVFRIGGPSHLGIFFVKKKNGRIGFAGNHPMTLKEGPG